MREPWSVNALSLELGPDRRSIAKWLDRAGVEPAGEGAKGPTFRLRDAVRVLADAGLLFGERERRERWGSYYHQALAAREMTGLALRALAKRLPDEALRTVREVFAEELFHYLAEVEALMRSQRFRRTESPAWLGMTDAELGRRLRALIDSGLLPTDGEEEGAP